MTLWNRDSDNNPLDLEEQADCYEALLSESQDENWLAGIFWWNWETNPNAGGPLDSGFTPQNKPAQCVLCKYYFKSDFNGDCEADSIDFAILGSQWFRPPRSPSADIAPEVPDGFVDLLDLAVFSDQWLIGAEP